MKLILFLLVVSFASGISNLTKTCNRLVSVLRDSPVERLDKETMVLLGKCNQHYLEEYDHIEKSKQSCDDVAAKLRNLTYVPREEFDACLAHYTGTKEDMELEEALDEAIATACTLVKTPSEVCSRYE